MKSYALRAAAVTVLLALAQLLGPAAPSAATGHGPLPRVMASAGDSITRAYDVGWCCVLRDAPHLSWSTGTSTSVDSHYRRLARSTPKIVGSAHNDARSGAKMRELAGQLTTAARQEADYVTVLMGANDVCTSSPGTMTPTATFEQQFRDALTAFAAARPRAKVLVASTPDVYRLWQLFRSNPVATFTWGQFGICQSMLGATRTEAERQQVVQRQVEHNAALERVCAQLRTCRWDGHAVYRTAFSTGDVSSVDYFHPSVRGQNRIAAVTWAAGWWPSL